MPVPIPVSKVGSDSQKVKFSTISGRPNTGFFGKISAKFRNFPQFPLATNHAALSMRQMTALRRVRALLALGNRFDNYGIEIDGCIRGATDFLQPVSF